MGDRRVLVVDDEPGIVEFLREVLDDAGYAPYCAASFDEAEQLLAEHQFGVAVVDKNLPGNRSGLDLLLTIVDRHPHTRTLVHTGFPSTESAIDALRAGAFDYVTKPADIELIVEKVKRAWEAYVVRRQRDELLQTYETLFEVIPGVVWFLTDSGVFRRISRQGAALLEYEPGDIVGMTYADLLDPDTDDPGSEWAFKERRTGKRATHRRTVTLRTRTGKRRLIELSSSAAYTEARADGTGYIGTLAVGWDVTEHVTAIEQLARRSKMDALGRLSGGIAHDFNNMLSVVLNNLQYLRTRVPDDNDALDALDDMQEVSQRARALTAELLLFSRREQVEPTVVDVGEVITGAHRMLERLVRADVELRISVDADVGRVLADKNHVHQVLINLATNRADAMPAGGELTIHAAQVTIDDAYANMHPELGPGEFAMIAVSDTGTGISEQVREHLYEPFFTTKEPGQGTGLGLSIVYSLVRRYGGHLSVYTETELGTTFKVYLPIAEDEAPRARRPSPTHQVGGSESVLLVEDDPLVRRVARRILVHRGYQVAEANNGAQALAAWDNSGPFDLLVTDVVMPEIGGAELAIALRERAPRLPVLYMSGYVGRLSVKRALLTELAHLEHKPFTEATLLRQVRRLLDEATGH